MKRTDRATGASRASRAGVGGRVGGGRCVSRPMLVVGAVLSLVLHAGALWGPGWSEASPPGEEGSATAVDVVELPARLADRDASAASARADVAEQVEVEAERAREPEREAADERALASRAADGVEREASSRAMSSGSSPSVVEPGRSTVTQLAPIRETAVRSGTEPAVETGAGDFASPRPGPVRPGLRIDWGRESEAVATLAATGMRLVVVDASRPGELPVVGAVGYGGGGWSVRPYRPEAGRTYSNRLRIVDDVPAFSGATRAAGLSSKQRLAVLVPTDVEQMLESAKLAAAFRYGLSLEDVRTFGGRFSLGGRASPGFEITAVERRSR